MFPVHQVWPNRLARHSERGKKTRRTKEEVGRQHQGMDRPGVRQVPEGSGEQRKMEKTGCKIICGAPTTLAVKGLMMMIIHRTLTWTTGSLTCAQMLMHATAQGGCTDTVREFALKAVPGRKNPLPHRGIEPASAACRCDTLPTELHPHAKFAGGVRYSLDS